MKTLLGIGLLILTGCGGVLANLQPSEPPVPVCVVRYQPLLPGYSLGSDGCGNVWVRHDQLGECAILVDSVSSALIQCPAEGDTLGDGR